MKDRAVRTIEVFDDKARLMEGAATAFVDAAREAIAARGRLVVALSGGSTPRALFELLASERFAPSVDWSHVHVCWGDERAVPPDADASNYRMAREALLDRVSIPDAQVYRIQSELAPQSAAAAYEETLRDLLPRDGRFDLILLGMGDNGHVASLFPGLTAVRENERWVVAEFVAEVAMWRITLTPVVLNAAAEVIVLVSGANKAAMLHRVLDGPVEPDLLPAQIVAPRDGQLRWLADIEAAARVQR